MMSERRFRELESQNRIPCNLCGSNGASVRCDKCESMAFCLSCDDMYHRHPKRRYHLRKAVALEMPKRHLEITQQNMNPNFPFNVSHISTHPSKMPVPPPRRKKKGITLSSIKETFTNTGNKLRRFVSNEKLSVPSVNGNKFLDECHPIENPIINKPMQTIRTQTLQNQRFLTQNNNFGTLPNIKRHNSFAAKLPETDVTAATPPPPPPKPKQLIPAEAFYENYRKASLQAQNLQTNVRLTKVSTSIGDLSNEIPSNAVPNINMTANAFERKNCSLTDLKNNNSMDDISNMSANMIPNMGSQQFFPQYLPNQICYGYPVHPWTTSSLNNSIEDINLNNNIEDYDSDVSARHNRYKRGSMKRSQSSFQMYPGMPPMSPIPPMHPFVYPYCYGHTCSGRTTPLPTCPSPHPHMKAYNLNSRGSVDNISSTSSSKDRSPIKSKYTHKQKADALESREQFSDSGGRSVTSSSRQQSEDEHFFSVSDDSSEESENQLSGHWSCRFCTFINENKNTICEICSKSKKKFKRPTNKNSRPNRQKNTKQSKPKVMDEKKDLELSFDQKLINEQKEIEKELIRRLENEKHFEQQNEIIDRREEYVRRKNLGLPVQDDLVNQIRKDNQLDQSSDVKSNSKDIKEDNLEKNMTEKSIENKSTECQTNVEFVERKSTETMTETEISSTFSDERCAKSVQSQSVQCQSVQCQSVQCQLDDNSNDVIKVKSSAENNSNSIGLRDQSISTINHFEEKTIQQNMKQNEQFINNFDGHQQQNGETPYNQNFQINRSTNQMNGNQSVYRNQQNAHNYNQSTAQNNNFDDHRSQYGSEQSFGNFNINGQNNNNNTNTNNNINGTNNQSFGYQNQQNMSNPMTPNRQMINTFDERRPYGPDSFYNQSSNQFQTPFNNNIPLNPLISPNIMSMNPLMSGFPGVPPMFASNPLQNMYSSPYQQSLNGSQTGLDRFGYRSNSITSEHQLTNTSQSQLGSRYSSCENLLSMNQLNEKNQQKSREMDSSQMGLHLLHILRDAEKNGFTSDDVEVALNFSPDKPIEWLEENWNNMCETVLTLTNNQIMQNIPKTGNKKLSQLNLLTEDQAREGLRASKGNIWQAIDRCTKTKQNLMQIKKDNEVNSPVDDLNKKTFSLKISGTGSGQENMDAFQDIESSDSSEEKQILDEIPISDEKVLLTSITVHTSEVQEIEMTDRKTIEKLLTDWKIEKLSSDRFRQQEKERQKMRKFMELQKKMSEFDSEESEADPEYHETLQENNLVNVAEGTGEQEDGQEIEEHVSPLPLPLDISEDKWQINSEFEFVDKNSEENIDERDFEEYNSNTEESDLSDEFDKIDARIQAKLNENFNLVKSEELPSNKEIQSEVIEYLVEKLGENSSSGNQMVNELMKSVLTPLDDNESKEPIELKMESNQEISKSEAKKIIKEIDRNVRKSLEELEEMELNVIQETQSSNILLDEEVSNKKEVKRELPLNHMYDETFGWARTEYECELCCEIFSIEDLVAMISCTHSACRQCLQKYYSVQIRERQRLIISCPFCDQPEIDPDDDDKVFEYLGLFDQMIKHLVPTDVYELFQRKLRDRALMRDPNFLWCTQCSSGFISPNPQAKTIMCPDCKNLTCTLCKKKWKKQHFDITCEEFAEWEKANDPSYAEQQLDKHLKEFGIECPNCKFRYQLAKGGCMHFRCGQCSYDFCGGCARPFKMGNRCGVSPYCEKLGLHSHHPRNCLFYLRDKDTDKLQSLLDKHKIKYKTKLESDHKSPRCPVMEQKHTSYGLKDENCNRFVENAGLCRLHYKEYLGDIIWKNGIDPIHIFNGEELELVLKRENVRLPPKDSYISNRPEIREEYHKQLIELILEKVPLNLHHY